ncbi:MAG: phage tail protein [Pseudomonadota bacterium]
MPIGIRYDGELRDPYKTYGYLIEFDGVEVAACRKMSAPQASLDVIEFRAGNSAALNSELQPGLVKYNELSFENGKTDDLHFQQWANQLMNHATRPLRAIEPNFRRTIRVKVRRDDGSIGMQYVFYNAFPKEYSAISELAADVNDVLIETLTIVYEGFDRVEVEDAGGEEAEGDGEEGGGEN